VPRCGPPGSAGAGRSSTSSADPPPCHCRHRPVSPAALAAGLGAAFSAGSGSGLIPTTGWKPFTSPATGGAANAYDRDPTTRWSSDALQQPGMYYGLDLGATYTLTRVIWDSSLPPGDCPRGLDVQVSAGNAAYTTVLSIPDTASSIAGGVLTVNLKVPARYIKFLGTKPAPGNYLSIHELYLYGEERR
jgi:hypothetical protein